MNAAERHQFNGAIHSALLAAIPAPYLRFSERQQVAEVALGTLEHLGFAVTKLPEEHFAGDYALVHIDCDEIYIDVSCLDNTDDARTIAAALLRAADQLDKQRAEERGPDGGELDWGARADDAHDAQVDRENGVTP